MDLFESSPQENNESVVGVHRNNNKIVSKFGRPRPKTSLRHLPNCSKAYPTGIKSTPKYNMMKNQWSHYGCIESFQLVCWWPLSSQQKPRCKIGWQVDHTDTHRRHTILVNMMHLINIWIVSQHNRNKYFDNYNHNHTQVSFLRLDGGTPYS